MRSVGTLNQAILQVRCLGVSSSILTASSCLTAPVWSLHCLRYWHISWYLCLSALFPSQLLPSWIYLFNHFGIKHVSLDGTNHAEKSSIDHIISGYNNSYYDIEKLKEKKVTLESFDMHTLWWIMNRLSVASPSVCCVRYIVCLSPREAGVFAKSQNRCARQEGPIEYLKTQHKQWVSFKPVNGEPYTPNHHEDS